MIEVIVVAGGKGRRFGGKKQWKLLKGKPVVAYCLEVFESHPLVSRILLGAPREDLKLAEDILNRFAPTKGAAVFEGGAERYETVERGLKLVRGDLVAIHDAVRPFVSSELVERLYAACGEVDGVVPVLIVRDTVKQVEGSLVKCTLPRESLRLVQTPQIFKTASLVSAYSRIQDKRGITDDASLMERAGGTIAVVGGDYRNFKITTREDWEMAERLCSRFRVGFGYDIHKTEPGEGVVLGGVPVPAGFSLKGHSDADVLIHAVVDALLGAVGLGDIGEWFPDTDPRYRGASSCDFLRKVVEEIKRRGYSILSLDVTVVAQKPKLSPYKERIRKNLADILGVDSSLVSVKAKTKEGLDAVGRLEAVEAYAVALVG